MALRLAPEMPEDIGELLETIYNEHQFDQSDIDAAVEEAHDDGREAGYGDGYDSGFDYGRDEGYEEGLSAGRADTGEEVRDILLGFDNDEPDTGAGYREACDVIDSIHEVVG